MASEEDKNLYQAFSQQFYAILDNSPINERGQKMRCFYNAEATMTFEGQTCVGAEAIAAKFQSLRFERIQHIVTTVDGQRLPGGLNAHLILVNGQLKDFLLKDTLASAKTLVTEMMVPSETYGLPAVAPTRRMMTLRTVLCSHL